MAETWPYCPMLGMSPTEKLRVDESTLGDGYTHRTIRGINPVMIEWPGSYPFKDIATLNAMLDFLRANGARGFLFAPPNAPTTTVLVTANDWQYSLTDKTGKAGTTTFGVLSVTMRRQYNPQPGA